MDKRLFLIDAMAMVYRAFYAFGKNPRYNSKKLNTSAIYGFTNSLLDILKNENPSHIAVAFDTSAPTFRHEEFPAYKAQREAMPEDLSLSIPYIYKMVEALNIPVVVKEGFEADDIIGTLAKQAEKCGYEVYMVTPDKDYGQLVSNNIFMYKPSKGPNPYEKWGISEVCARFGLEYPMQLTDLIGLWGDASDNIPGVPGIGEVWAKKLIAGFGTLENLIANAHDIDNEKMREKIIIHSEQALLSKHLGTISTDVPVQFNEADYTYSAYDKEKLTALFDELEFRQLARRVFDLKAPSQQTHDAAPGQDLFSEAGISEEPLVQEKKQLDTSKVRYFLTDTPVLRQELLSRLKTSTSFCFDTETTGLDINASELVGIAFCLTPHEAYYMPLPPVYAEAVEILSPFREVFENSDIGKTGHNIKFDMSMLHHYDIEVTGPLFDTMIAHYLIEPDMKHGMDYLADVYLNYKTVPIENLIGKKGSGQLTMDTVDAETVRDYACEDADITLQLRYLFEPMLQSQGLMPLFVDVEMPLVAVLSAMELEGVAIDTRMLAEISATMQNEINELEKEIHTLAGVVFNISSPKQLGEVLFERLEIVKKSRMTKTKQYSTGEDVLSKLLHKHPIVGKVLEYRSLTKLQSTYIDALPKLIAVRTGRVHSSFNQAVASTGRLSSNNPNLQNIPVRTERGKEIRKAFVPRSDNFVILSADYSQIELRLMAELSGDENLREAFREGLDIHTATAARVFGKMHEDVTPDLRRIAKMVNFGIIYGISAFGLAERLGTISRTEAAAMIDAYFKEYPGIRKYMDDTMAQARRNEYVETLLGRKRYIRDINSQNAVVRGYAERNAINAPIQGSAADMIKIAMIGIYKDFKAGNLRSKMIMQVHDELVFEVFKPETEQVKAIVSERMKNALPLHIPVEIDMKTGLNWLEAH